MENETGNIVKEVAIESAVKLIELVYEDALRPPAKQVGKALEDIFRALRLLTLPFQGLSFLQDKLDIFLKRTLAKIEEEKRVLPPGQVILKFYQELSIYNLQTVHMDLFSNLMACFINKEKLSEAHPAFLIIIPQLSEDEIVILRCLQKTEYALEEYARYNNVSHLFDPRVTRRNDFPLRQLCFPQNFFMYMNHLHSLNVAGCWQDGNQIPDLENGMQKGATIISKIQLTDFGRMFAKACITA